MSTNREKIELEKIKFGIRHMVSESLLNDLVLELHDDVVSENIIWQLTGYVLGNKIHTESFDRTVKTYPATMWEELKEDFAPEWFLKRYPVRYHREITKKVTNHYHVCPHLDYPREKHIIFLQGEVSH